MHEGSSAGPMALDASISSCRRVVPKLAAWRVVFLTVGLKRGRVLTVYLEVSDDAENLHLGRHWECVPRIALRSRRRDVGE